MKKLSAASRRRPNDRRPEEVIGCRPSQRQPRNKLSTSPPTLVPPHGGYRDLQSFQMAEIVYDGTVFFCDRFINRRSRTHDQMVQAARSGKQNIAEGSMASGTSKKTELKLVGVPRASLEELLLEKAFLKEGGFTERLYLTRTQARGPWKRP
jgi:four helix bundle protein